ncbi:MAG: FAD-dependent oxidoreductase [Gemmatimonadaceae bacterium]
MDLTSGNPLWPALDGLPHTYTPLEHDTSADVVVIGGGITGALVADALVKAGVDTIVLDKRDVGRGSTCASTALLQYELDVPLTELRERRGSTHANRAYRATRRAIDDIAALVATLPDPVGFRRRQSLYLVSRERDVEVHRREFAARRQIGLDVAWLERNDLQRCFGIDRPAAILSEDAAEVNAFALAHALLAGAAARGLRVFTRTQVERVDAKAAGVAIHLSEGRIVSARHVVFATGYETREFVGVGPARLVSTFAIASAPGAVPLPWRESGALIWERADPYLYLRTTPDDRVIIGGEDEDFRDPAHRDALIPAKTECLTKRYRELFPDASIDVTHAWTGTFGETDDGLPYIGAHPDWPSCSFALGYGGNGIVFSMLAAELVRDATLGRVNPLAELFRFGR